MKSVALLFLGLLACAAPRPASPASAPSDEAALMERIRSSVAFAPDTALSLAEEGDRRFANSAASEERGALAIRALINMQRIGGARGRAEVFLRRYPDGRYSSDVAAMTGVHPVPQGPGKR